MNVSISGSGTVASGEYEAIRISGSGKLNGLVRCSAFSSSGSSRGAELDCSGAVKVSGSSSFSKSMKAQSLGVSGSLELGGDLRVGQELQCSGSLDCGGSIRCGSLRVTGEVEADEDVEAETVNVSGILDCEGLLNAETLLITGSGMTIGSIGGSSITIRRPTVMGKLAKIPLLSTLFKSVTGKIEVKGSIEGDTVELENVHCPRVSGRVVTIGKDCQIDLVQYSQELQLDPGAKVGKSEKLPMP